MTPRIKAGIILMDTSLPTPLPLRVLSTNGNGAVVEWTDGMRGFIAVRYLLTLKRTTWNGGK